MDMTVTYVEGDFWRVVDVPYYDGECVVEAIDVERMGLG